MSDMSKNYAFCTLALGKKYVDLAQKMSLNLSEVAPGITLVVFTDDISAFSSKENVIAIAFKQQGALHCYHDKRFAIAYTLEQFNTAVMIDVDASFTDRIPQLNWNAGLEGNSENMIEHVSKFTPERLVTLRRVAQKVGVDIQQTTWVGESIFAVTRDGGKEKIFIEAWGKIGRYLELHKIHAGSGNAIGMAASMVGWVPRKSEEWKTLKSLWSHFDASLQRTPPTEMQKFKRRLNFHYRLNLQRLQALEDIRFYYL